MQTEQLMCWSGMTDTAHTASGHLVQTKQNVKHSTHSMSPESLLTANFTLVGVHATLTIFHIYSYLSSPAASTNQHTSTA